MDPSMSNIMKNEEGTLFVDWKIPFILNHERRKKTSLLPHYRIHALKLFVSHNEMNLKFSQESRQSIMNIIDEETKLIRLKIYRICSFNFSDVQRLEIYHIRPPETIPRNKEGSSTSFSQVIFLQYRS